MDEELEEQRVLAAKLREFFSSPDEAAISALSKITEKKYELGGIISQAGDRYYTSEPMGDKRTGSFTARVKLPQGERAVGLYHSHPSAMHESIGDSELFSPGDVETAQRMKMLSYIKALASDKIKKFEPGKTNVRLYGRGDRRTVSDGELLKQKIIAEALLARPPPGSEP